jgi:hypothetical protein
MHYTFLWTSNPDLTSWTFCSCWHEGKPSHPLKPLTMVMSQVSTDLPAPTLLLSAVQQCCGISHLQWLAWVDKMRCDRCRLLDIEVAHEAGREDTPHEGQGRAILVHPQGH